MIEVESEAVKMYDNPMYNPALLPYMGMQQQRQVQRQEVVKVNGENGAMALQLPPNSSAIALDMSGVLRFPTAWTYAGGQFPPTATA